MKKKIVFIVLIFSFTYTTVYSIINNEIREIPINEVQEEMFFNDKVLQDSPLTNEEESLNKKETNSENSDFSKIHNDEAKEDNNVLYLQKTDLLENLSNKIDKPSIQYLNNIEKSENISTSEKTAEDLRTTKRESLIENDKFEEISDRANRVTALGSAMGAIDLGNTPTKKIRLGAGVGNASSSQAVAVGVGYAPTERFKVNTKFSTSTNNFFNNSISVGASYDLDI